MYNSYFGFAEKPFTIAPNPRYLFMSERHQEALAHMLYGLQGEGGVMVLTGEVGTGKTTICRRLLEQVPEKTRIAYIINPKLTTLELLANICDELHINYAKSTASIKIFTDLLNKHLLTSHAQDLHTVLIIDEAQNLDVSVLEQLRLLTNLETNEKKLLQIMLIGQPELADILQRNELRQLAQRITARYHLTPLNKHEVSAYINHRLSIAGSDKQRIFSSPVIRLLYKHTRGVPRLINLIADRALLGAYSCESKLVSKKIMKQAISEVCGAKQHQRFSTFRWVSVSLLLLMLGATLFYTTSMDNTLRVNNISAAMSIEASPTPQAPTAILPKPDALQVSNNTAGKDIPFHRDKNEAFKAIFSAWHIDYQPKRDGEACSFAKQHQLRCLRQRGDIAQMRSLSRPAVLAISNQDGQAAFVAITALTGTRATVKANGLQADINLSQLVLQSHNDFTILWRAPKGYTGPVRPGHEGKLVQLLAKKCTLAQKQQWIGAPRLKYDLGLKEQIKSFQRSQGLNPDGVAGPITWIHINSLTNKNTPTLQSTMIQNDGIKN